MAVERLKIGVGAPVIWHRILDLVDNFETDHGGRRNLQQYACAQGAFLLEEWELDESPASFRRIGSHVWFREATRVYLEYLYFAIENLRGSSGDSIATTVPEAFVSFLRAVSRGLSEWLGSTNFRRLVHSLCEALEQAFYFFNVQFVTNWVQVSVGRSDVHGLPAICDGVTTDRIREDLYDLHQISYGHGSRAYQGIACIQESIHRFHSVSINLRRVFLLNHRQLMTLAARVMGSPVSAEDVLELEEEFGFDDSSLKQRKEEPIVWDKSPGGIFIPTWSDC